MQRNKYLLLNQTQIFLDCTAPFEVNIKTDDLADTSPGSSGSTSQPIYSRGKKDLWASLQKLLNLG
jgi:hypothetical protein